MALDRIRRDASEHPVTGAFLRRGARRRRGGAAAGGGFRDIVVEDDLGAIHRAHVLISGC